MTLQTSTAIPTMRKILTNMCSHATEHVFGLSSAEGNELRSQFPPVDGQLEHRPLGRAPALGRRARVQDPDLAVELDLRDMRVPVDDGVAAGEAADEPGLPPRERPGNVHDPDAHLARLDDPLLRQLLPQRR